VRNDTLGAQPFPFLESPIGTNLAGDLNLIDILHPQRTAEIGQTGALQEMAENLYHSFMAATQLAIVWLVSAAAAATTFDLVEIAKGVSPNNIEGHLRYLADDKLAGRAPGTPGSELAAGYLEEQLRKPGLEPAFPGSSYQQPVPLHESRPLLTSELKLWRLGKSTSLALGDDYVLQSWGPASAIPRRAPLVFVGYGIVAPELDYNDYFDVDVNGAVVVYLAGEPEFFSGDETTVYASPETKRRIAQSRGAVGSILLPKVRGDIKQGWSGFRKIYSLPGLELPQSLPDHTCFILNPRLIPSLFNDAPYVYDQVRLMQESGTLRPFRLPIHLTFSGRFANRDFLGKNIGAVLPGRSPDLSRSVVVVSAHYDHLGVSPESESGVDRIYNGAVDNALGVAGVLELARVMSELPIAPKRSTLFLFTTAEEAGMLGARHFLDHPPVKTSHMVANVNVDGLAFLDTFSDLILVGGALSSIGDTFARALRPLDLEIGTAPPELWIQGGFARSDQLAFAQAGVPAVMVNEGFTWHHHDREHAVLEALRWLVTRYHTPSDDLDQELNFDASRLHLQAVLALVVTLAEDSTEPTWKPGTPYAYERALTRARGR
jgi:hypothetical protein